MRRSVESLVDRWFVSAVGKCVDYPRVVGRDHMS